VADKLEVVIIGKDELSATLKGIQGSMEGLADIAKGALTVGLGAATAAFGAMSAAVAISVKEAMDAEVAAAQLNAVLKSTGGIAGVTADAVQDLSRSLSLVTRYGDDAITAGQSILLTFTGIGKDIFPEATKAMLDMSTAMGQDLKTTAIQLGKALNSPAEGLSALTRVGVRFTAQQEQMVKSLVAQGKTVEAQKIILQELQTEFGGSAEEAGTTLAGQLDILRNKLLNVAEGIGNQLLPVLSKLSQEAMPTLEKIAAQVGASFTVLLPKFLELGNSVGKLIGEILKLAGVDISESGLLVFIMNATTEIGKLVDTAKKFTDWLTINLPPALEQAQVALKPLTDAFKNLSEAISKQMPAVIQNLDVLKEKLSSAFTNIIAPELIGNLSGIVNKIAEIWSKHGETIITIVRIAFGGVFATIAGALILVTSALETLLIWISGIFDAISLAMQGKWGEAWDALKLAFSLAVLNLLSGFEAFFNMVASLLGTNMESIRATWQANWDMVVLIIKTIWDNIQKAIAAKIIEIILNIKKFIADVLATIEGYKQAFIDMGGNMMNWMTQGIRAAAEGLMNAIRDASGRAINSVRELLPMGTTTRLQIENVQDAIIAPGGRIISTAPDDFLIATKTPGRLLGGAGAGGVTVNLYYAPAVSFGDRYEAEQTLVPILREALRQL
jgi:Flp pilus assembly pilin Flp